MRSYLFICSLVCVGQLTFAAESATVHVGVSKVDVTPTVPVVLAGYGSRTHEYEGIDEKLWARALVIGERQPVVVVVLDNCGVPRSAVERLAARLIKHGITGDRLVVAATHTHTAPTLVDYAPILWSGRTTPKQDQQTQAYTDFAIEQMEKAITQALNNREPMSLEWAQGRVGFGGNRRVLTENLWTGFGLQRDGPVDHSLPVLAARDARGTVRATWCNYACHCTTVGSRNFVGGDWAGYANTALEKSFPEAISLTSIGCGADIGPQPSGELQHARQHGQSIATEVQRLLSEKTTPLQGEPSATSRRIKLPLQQIQPRTHWEIEAQQPGFNGQLAKLLLKSFDETGTLPSHVEYPLSVWRFGEDLAIVFLAGEVVVDYSVRLKHELDWSRVWITAWSNGMPGYIPSRRILDEGGYEAEFSQIYYAQPGPYAREVEDLLVNAVKELVGEAFAAREEQPSSPYHRLADGP